MSGVLSPYPTALVYQNEPLTSGVAIIPRWTCVANSQLYSGVLNLTYWNSTVTQAAGHVETYVTGTASSGATYANVGIYAIASNGDLTLLASTGDVHTTIWAGQYTLYNTALTSTFSQQPGTSYALGVLAVGTGLPGLAGAVPSGLEFIAPILHGVVSGLSTLPATVAHATIVQDPDGPLMCEAIIKP